MKHFNLFIILFIPYLLSAQPYKLEVNWEYTSSYEIDIDDILYEDEYGRISYEDQHYDPNNKNDLNRECRKMNSIIPDAIEALSHTSSDDECFELIIQVKELIASGNLSRALDAMVDELGMNCLPKDFIHISSRINKIEKMFTCGIVKFSDYDIIINRSTLVFLGALDDLLAVECNCN